MSHPVLWPQKTFFYPIGNTAPVSLTRDLPPEARAEALLLGCGDPRNILFTLYNEKDVGTYRLLRALLCSLNLKIARQYDFTCCDNEPGVLGGLVYAFSAGKPDNYVDSSKHSFAESYHGWTEA